MSVPKNCVPANLTAVKLPALWGWEGWYVISLIAIMFVVIVKDWVRVEFAMLLTLNMMIAAQIITVDQGFIGFSNSGVLTVTILFVVAEGLSATGAIDYYLNKMMGNPRTLGLALVRMTFPNAIISAFINNTPQVALMIPILAVWARKVNIPPSQLMLPMSYASILGGTLSQLGTSTNLVVAGKVAPQYCKAVGLFDIGIVGVPTTFLGLTYILLFTQYLLPDAAEYKRRQNARLAASQDTAKKVKKSKGALGQCCQKFRKLFGGKPKDGEIDSDADDGWVYGDGGGDKSGYESYANFNPSRFVMHGTIDADSPLDGKQVEQAGLRGVGFFLITVQRGQTIFNAVGPQFVLQRGDIVSFTGGSPREFVGFALSKRISPISVVDDANGDESGDESMSAIRPDTINPVTYHAVVRADSSLVGQTAKEANFRATYNASIIAISRAGERLQNAHLGKIVFKIGDNLILVGNEKFSWEDPTTARDLKQGVNTELDLTPIEDLRVTREFVIPMVVAKKSQIYFIPSIHRRTIRKSGVTDVPGVALVAVQRGENLFHDVQPDFILEEGDTLWFVGDRDAISGLRRVPGLKDSVQIHLDRLAVPLHYRRLVEVVVSHRADFVNQTVRESRFRTRYSAAVVSVLRMDFRNLHKIGEYEIKGGDVLIVDSSPDFVKFFRDDPNFALVSEIPNSTPPRWDKFYIAFVATLLMVILEVVFSVNMAVLGIFAAGVMLTFGVLSGERAHASVEWGVIITVASAFGMSTALEKTYVAGIIGNAFVQLAVITKTGVPGLVCTILAATMLFSSLIANNAAALLMFPIAAQAAATMKVDPTPIIFALMLGASDYATPFGYQTNQMVQRPGGYVPIDYLKYGLPLMIVLLIGETIFLSTIAYWYVSWIVTAGIYILAIIFDVTVRNKTPLRQVIYLPRYEDVAKWGKEKPGKLLSKMTSARAPAAAKSSDELPKNQQSFQLAEQ